MLLPDDERLDIAKLASVFSDTTNSCKFYWLLAILDSLRKNGQPRIAGVSMVGKPANEVAWYVMQHSPKIKQYFPLIQRAGQAKELPFLLVAMMQDRLMTEQRKPQLYGTQAACYPLMDTASHQQECFFWPIANPKNVNRRRKKAGFTTTVEENAKRLNVAYQILTMEKLTETVATTNLLTILLESFS